jgi:hypothetical protein
MGTASANAHVRRMRNDPAGETRRVVVADSSRCRVPRRRALSDARWPKA